MVWSDHSPPSLASSMPVLSRAATGIALKLLSTIAFTAMAMLVRITGERVPIGEVVFCRAFFALIPLFLMLAWQRELALAFKVESVTQHVVRGGIGASGMVFGFIAVTLLPLADAVAIGYAAPLMVVPLAALILGEKVRIYRWSAVAIGFVGVVVILWPHLDGGLLQSRTDAQAIGALCAIGGAICAAFATIQVRRLVNVDPTAAIVFMFMALCTIMSLLSWPLGYVLPIGRWVWPSAFDAFLLVTLGILGGLGQMLLTESYKRAETSLIAPFEYFSMIWAVIVGLAVFGDVPGVFVIVGGLIVVASGVFVIWREHILGLERARQRTVTTTTAQG